MKIFIYLEMCRVVKVLTIHTRQNLTNTLYDRVYFQLSYFFIVCFVTDIDCVYWKCGIVQHSLPSRQNDIPLNISKRKLIVTYWHSDPHEIHAIVLLWQTSKNCNKCITSLVEVISRDNALINCDLNHSYSIYI